MAGEWVRMGVLPQCNDRRLVHAIFVDEWLGECPMCACMGAWWVANFFSFKKRWWVVGGGRGSSVASSSHVHCPLLL